MAFRAPRCSHFRRSDQAHQEDREVLTDATMAAAIVKISTAAYVLVVDSGGSSASPSSRSSAGPASVPYRDLTRHAALDDGRVVSKERTMASGTVKWFNAQKGYGFIQPEDGSKDVFVHISAVERAGLSQLNENQKVTYELERGQQGKTSAVNLQVS